MSKLAWIQDQVDADSWHFLGSMGHATIKVNDINPSWGVKNDGDDSRTVGAVHAFTPRVPGALEW